jgi:transcriptional regulator with XRE-family HTH domain
MARMMQPMNKIKRWLEDNERAIAWLARKAGMSRQALSNLLNGHSQPGLPTLRKLSLATGIPEGELAESWSKAD